jgi:hypothetical protein
MTTHLRMFCRRCDRDVDGVKVWAPRKDGTPGYDNVCTVCWTSYPSFAPGTRRERARHRQIDRAGQLVLPGVRK